ncbi:hypothetical protein ACFLTE_04840 [Bacteroidota bacterium]
MKKITLLLIISVFAGITLCYAGKYQHLQTNEGVEFYYKWKNSKIFDKASPLVLIVKIKNTNIYALEVAYTVDYFWDGITKASSDKKTTCIKQKKAIVLDGRKQGFDTAGLSNEQILSESFVMEINGVAIQKTEMCIKKKS